MLFRSMDLDEPNKMDSKPFLVLDLLDIDKLTLPELSLGKAFRGALRLSFCPSS